jgi:hypothetical protein
MTFPVNYVVTLSQGSACRAQGLKVEFKGIEAFIKVNNAIEYDIFWGARLAFLRANPLAD